LSQLVNETILNMRRFLIDKKIIELQEFQKEDNKNDILEQVMSYYKLKKVLSAKLNRVV
jgi:DNA primase